MADFTGIQGVTETLRQLLLERMEEAALNDVTTANPDLDATPDGPWVNLFLYRITENAELKNQDLPGMSGPMSFGHPPLSLDLHYLLTAEGLDADDNRGAHRVLGDAMLVLHDHPIISKDDPILQPTLQNEVELVKITLEPLDSDDLSKIWTATTAPYRLSVGYKVTLVQLESTLPRTIAKPVLEPPDAGPRVYAVPTDRPQIASVSVIRPPSTEELSIPYAGIGDVLVIRGSSFYPGTRVLLGDVDVTATLQADSTSSMVLAPIPNDPDLQAGVQRLQLVRDIQLGEPPRDFPAMRSNVSAFVLIPTVTGTNPAGGGSGTVLTIQGQNLIADAGPTIVLIGDNALIPESGATATQLQVAVTDVDPDPIPHQVRVRVNGAESLDSHTFLVSP